LKIGINDYKKLSQIEIEIIPINKENKNVFIDIPNEYKSYYYIHFNEDKKELKQNYFNKNEKIRKIKIIIDKKIKSFEKLFFNCDCIEKINFIRFNRKDINNMSSMFQLFIIKRIKY